MLYGQHLVNKGLKSYKQIQTIVLDAGHGGKDSGCLGKHSQEKDIALSITKKIGEKLQHLHPNLKIIYTRDRDIFIPLHQRSQIANDAKADLFVSIHCNAVGNKHIHGSETYVMGLHRADDNLAVAKRENESIYLENDFKKNYNGYDPNSPIGHIMLSTYQNIHLEQSVALASIVEESMLGTCKHSRGVKQAGFVVLREATMPSVLIETGFLTNKNDEALLNSKSGQEKIANDITSAISKMLGKAPSKEVFKEKAPEIATSIKKETPLKVSPTEFKSASHSNIGPIYKLQIAAFRKTLSPDAKEAYDIYPQTKIIEIDGVSKVWVGAFDSLEKAVAYQKTMRSRGHKGAFVVEYDTPMN